MNCALCVSVALCLCVCISIYYDYNIQTAVRRSTPRSLCTKLIVLSEYKVSETLTYLDYFVIPRRQICDSPEPTDGFNGRPRKRYGNLNKWNKLLERSTRSFKNRSKVLRAILEFSAKIKSLHLSVVNFKSV
jgi:hypothetical protein